MNRWSRSYSPGRAAVLPHRPRARDEVLRLGPEHVVRLVPAEPAHQPAALEVARIDAQRDPLAREHPRLWWVDPLVLVERLLDRAAVPRVVPVALPDLERPRAPRRHALVVPPRLREPVELVPPVHVVLLDRADAVVPELVPPRLQARAARVRARLGLGGVVIALRVHGHRGHVAADAVVDLDPAAAPIQVGAIADVRGEVDGARAAASTRGRRRSRSSRASARRSCSRRRSSPSCSRGSPTSRSGWRRAPPAASTPWALGAGASGRRCGPRPCCRASRSTCRPASVSRPTACSRTRRRSRGRASRAACERSAGGARPATPRRRGGRSAP